MENFTLKYKTKNNNRGKEKLKLLILEAREDILRMKSRIDTLTEVLEEFEKHEEQLNKQEYKI